MKTTEITVNEAIMYLNEEADSMLKAAILYSGDNYVESTYMCMIRRAKALFMAVNALRGD